MLLVACSCVRYPAGHRACSLGFRSLIRPSFRCSSAREKGFGNVRSRFEVHRAGSLRVQCCTRVIRFRQNLHRPCITSSVQEKHLGSVSDPTPPSIVSGVSYLPNDGCKMLTLIGLGRLLWLQLGAPGWDLACICGRQGLLLTLASC
jgi:hypothetical protein